MKINEIILNVINDKENENAVKFYKSGKYGMIGYLFGKVIIYIKNNNINIKINNDETFKILKELL